MPFYYIPKLVEYNNGDYYIQCCTVVIDNTQCIHALKDAPKGEQTQVAQT